MREPYRSRSSVLRPEDVCCIWSPFSRWATFSCAAALILLAAGLRAQAQEVIREDFDDGGAAGWLPVYGSWEVHNGTFRIRACQEGGGHLHSRLAYGGSLPSGGVVLFGKPRWEDYEVRATVVEGTDVPNTLLRVKDMGNCIQFGRYGRKLVLYQFKDGAPLTVEERDKPGTLPETLTASIAGTEFKGYCNGALVIEHRFRPDEIPRRGKMGLQANHPFAAFDDVQIAVFKSANELPAGKVEIGEIVVPGASSGLNRISVPCSNPAGVEAISGVYADVGVIAEGKEIPVPCDPLTLTHTVSATEGVWEGDLFSLHEGEHRIVIHAYDLDDAQYEKVVTIPLRARDGTYLTCGDTKLFDLIDPHPVWRGAVDHSVGLRGEESFPNYLWQTTWTARGVKCQALTLEPQPSTCEDARFRIVTDPLAVLVYPEIKDPSGAVLSGAIRRYLGETASLFCVQPTYECDTPLGKLVWRMDLWNGDPILRFRSTFHAAVDAEVDPTCVVEGMPKAFSYLVPLERGTEALSRGGDSGPVLISSQRLGDNFILWSPAVAEGAGAPVFAYSFNRRPVAITCSGKGKWTFSFGLRTVRAGEVVDLPAFSLILVDAFSGDGDLTASLGLARDLTHAALAVPSPGVSYQDQGLKGCSRFDVTLKRDYTFENNDWGVKDTGQMFPVPWCAGTNTKPKSTGTLHTAFGRYPYVVTKKTELTLRLPLPELSTDKGTPDYRPLSGDWLEKAAECINYLDSQQNEDGTFRGYDRMDHYSLGRMTLGLMVGYKGIAARPEVQEKIALMVRKALARMMGEGQVAVREEMRLDKGFSTGVDKVAWKEGEVYEPFAYLPKWGVHTEMGSLVDQNLGHAHLFFTLLLYGRYIDPQYLRRGDIQDKIRELIKFQWLSQDWNGDIWRVYVGGVDAAGGGDGFEEDLAMTLPVLAESAGLEPDWVNLAYRVAAMKYGALREFDYLPLENELGFEFLTPMHHPTDWVPEGGWDLAYRGDIWWTGPSVCSGYYGPWYVDSVYKPRPAVFRHQWYRLLEDYRDLPPVDGRHWLTVGGYCSEARLFDPFLGAVKLVRAYRIAKEKDFLTPSTRGEYIWNFAFYPAAFTVINHELGERFSFMKGAEPVDEGATSPDPDRFPVCSWKLEDGAVISVAGYRIAAPQNVKIRLNTERLELKADRYLFTTMKPFREREISCPDTVMVRVQPHSATTVVLEASRRSKLSEKLRCDILVR